MHLDDVRVQLRALARHVLCRAVLCYAELRDGYASLVEGAVTRRKVDPTEPTSATYW
jgi:hypothetical protein